MEVYKGHPRIHPYCEITGQRYLNGCTCNSCRAFFDRGKQRSAERRKNHRMKGCNCPDCVKRREYNRIAMKNLYRQHPIRGCQCDWCKKRREQIRRDYPKKKVDMRFKARSFKAKVVAELGGKCVLCGMTPAHVCQIDLHERNGRIARNVDKPKYMNPARLINLRWGKLLIWKHLDELIPLCKNCHALTICKLCNPAIEARLREWKRPNNGSK